VDWIGLGQDSDNWTALAISEMNFRVLKNAGKLSSGYIVGGLSSSAQLHRVRSLVGYNAIFVSSLRTEVR
jgi:hypothetical protein